MVPEDVKASGYQIGADELGSVVEGRDQKKLIFHGGVPGIAHPPLMAFLLIVTHLSADRNFLELIILLKVNPADSRFLFGKPFKT